MGVARAMVDERGHGRPAGQGGSTITQQAARNMFLSLDKTLRRKLSEVFVTYRMEKDFTKEQILATYLNVIFFGQRSYGIAAAAETFYGKRAGRADGGARPPRWPASSSCPRATTRSPIPRQPRCAAPTCCGA